jgi:fructose-specific phosphotransferase system IIA component
MKLMDLLTADCVKVNLEAEDKEEAIAELVEQLVRAGRIPDRGAAIRCIFARENRQSTGIGHGVAIPHGKDATVPRLTVAVGTSGAGIEFDSLDDEPVHLVFVVLAEENNPGPHIQALAEIARLLQDNDVYARLRSATEAQDVLAAIGRFEAGQIA